jgi:probable addiction module antidote protein
MATRPYSETLKEVLKDPKDVAEYLGVVLKEEDEAGFLVALRNIAEVRGMAEVAKLAGVGRESLYKTLSENGNPKLSTLVSVLHGIGIRLSFEPENDGHAAR